MAFTGYSRVLPDPYNALTTAGQRTGTRYGPGFSSVTVGVSEGGQVDRTNSGRVVSRLYGGNYLTAEITYNELTKTDFEPVSSFILSRNCKVVPFFVELPQYTTPDDAGFAAFAGANTIQTSGSHAAGLKYLVVTSAGTFTSALPKPNSLINIVDSSNTNHTKAYLITRVETNTDYETSLGPPGSNKLRLSLHAPLSKAVATGSTVTFLHPMMKCLLTSRWEYKLDNDNLYNFGIQVEEAEY